MAQDRKLSSVISGAVFIGAIGLLWLLERRRPLRPEVESKLTRTGRNLAVAGVAAVALQLIERPVVQRVTRLVEKRRWGLLKQVSLPLWLETLLAVVLMDYTLYLWHVLMHRWPVLWRFHLPHHVDLDLDTSTALRFHAGELAIATVWRVGQLVLIGVSQLSFSVWQTFVLFSIIFHHSNLRLPIGFERKLNLIFVTPRMHGIHHSIVAGETNSNWSSGLTVWDWLHGTLKLDVPQDEITIGVPAYRDESEVTLGSVLTMPFLEQRSTWRLPGDGQPQREVSHVQSNKLLA